VRRLFGPARSLAPAWLGWGGGAGRAVWEYDRVCVPPSHAGLGLGTTTPNPPPPRPWVLRRRLGARGDVVREVHHQRAVGRLQRHLDLSGGGATGGGGVQAQPMRTSSIDEK